MADVPVEPFLADEIDALAAAVEGLRDPDVIARLGQVLTVVVACLRSGGTVFFAGNGGSAADADHVAAEFVGRCTRERGPLPAIALTTSSATLTAVANDFGYEQAFARQVAALVRADDVLVLLSTSGRSRNVVAAAEVGRARGAAIVAFVGAGGSDLADAADLVVHAPSTSTQRIQEMHTFFGHALAAWVDRELS